MDGYSLENPTVDQIIAVIDAEMAASNQPKVILFDIGGVCVQSPFQAILDYELSLGIPPGWVNYSISKTAPNGFWHKLERGEVPLDKTFYAGFNEDLHNPARWQTFYQREAAKNPSLSKKVPGVPIIDDEWLFNEMMRVSTSPDPWMFPALKNLKASGKYILAALSNTIIFPPGHALHHERYFDEPLRKLFDVFVSSAHIGLRKPDPKIYQYAVKAVRSYARGHGAPKGRDSASYTDVKPEDILFLDDIGENLKAARNEGFRTIKVQLGRAYEAVNELEKVTGLTLAGDYPKIPVRPKLPESKAKI